MKFINQATAPFILVLLGVVALFPGMTGGFAFDDYPNILNNPYIADTQASVDNLLQAGWTGTAGPFKRPLAMMSFAGNYFTTGLSPFAFKITNLIIHLINGVLAYYTALLLLRTGAFRAQQISPATQINLALVVAGIWLLHPLNISPALYIVQRMTSLAALFSFAAVITYLMGRLRQIDDRGGSRFLIYFVTPLLVALGTLSKENALLTLPILALIEICFLKFHASSKFDARLLKILVYAGALAAVVAGVILFMTNPNWLSSKYDGRPFTLIERLLTQSRVLWFYVSLLLIPRLGSFALYHDDIVLSTSFTEPLTTSFSVLGLAVIGLMAIVGFRRYPIFTFAVFWFLIGHVIESSVFALELVHEHRNYFPSFGLIFGTCVGVWRLCKRFDAHSITKRVGIATLSIIAALGFFRASDWSDPVTLAITEALHHPQSYRSVYAAARVYYGMYLMQNKQEYYDEAVSYLEVAGSLDKDAKRPYFGLLRLAYNRGRAPKEEWTEELRSRLRTRMFSVHETSDLQTLVECHASNPDCKIPKTDILSFYSDVLSNDSVKNNLKAQLQLDLAVFYVNEFQEFTPAITLIEEAVEQRPDEFAFRKVLTQIYILAGEAERATKSIEILTQASSWKDRYRTPSDEISALESMLKEKLDSATSE